MKMTTAQMKSSDQAKRPEAAEESEKPEPLNGVKVRRETQVENPGRKPGQKTRTENPGRAGG